MFKDEPVPAPGQPCVWFLVRLLHICHAVPHWGCHKVKEKFHRVLVVVQALLWSELGVRFLLMVASSRLEWLTAIWGQHGHKKTGPIQFCFGYERHKLGGKEKAWYHHFIFKGKGEFKSMYLDDINDNINPGIIHTDEDNHTPSSGLAVEICI